MRLSQGLVTGVAGISFALMTAPQIYGTPVSGTFDIAGLGGAQVGATTLTFSPCVPNASLGVTCTGVTDSGSFGITGATGDFGGLVGTGGYIHDLNSAAQPINQMFSLPNFITFTGSDIQLELQFIFTGVDPQASCLAAPAPGQTCTPVVPALVTPANPGGLSPYNLQNTAGRGSTASFSVMGIANHGDGEMNAFTGQFTAQFNVPYQTLLTELASGTLPRESYSATFTVTPIPEPGTASLFIGAGLILVGKMFSRRALKRN